MGTRSRAREHNVWDGSLCEHLAAGGTSDNVPLPEDFNLVWPY